MTKTEIKHSAQEQIMLALANVLINFEENHSEVDFIHEDAVKVHEEIKAQAKRVAKIMGYNDAWYN